MIFFNVSEPALERMTEKQKAALLDVSKRFHADHVFVTTDFCLPDKYIAVTIKADIDFHCGIDEDGRVTS